MSETDVAVLRGAIEAILLASPQPVGVTELMQVMEEDAPDRVRQILEELIAAYGNDSKGLMIEEVAGGYRLVTRPEFDSYLRRFFNEGGKNKLSVQALETLAIVAYKQPITAPEIQDVRGVNPGGTLKTLLDRRLIKISGRKAVVGNPFLYKTTEEFLIHFGLNDIKDLPTLEEFRELLEGAEGI